MCHCYYADGCPACNQTHSIVQVLKATSPGMARHYGLGYLVSLGTWLHMMCFCICHGQCVKQTWLFLQASSQAEAAITRQRFIRETPQASTICILWSMPAESLPKVPAALPEPSAAQQQQYTTTAHAGSHSAHCRAVSQPSTSDVALSHDPSSSCPACHAGSAAAAARGGPAPASVLYGQNPA